MNVLRAARQRINEFLWPNKPPAKPPGPDLLAELVSLSQARLGFFPSTPSRGIEYKWFAERMKNCAGKIILDVGAGVNVLPLWLSDRGASVTTVDFHTMIRDPSNKEGWNEWGYLDYSLLDFRIKSHNISITNFLPKNTFDCIYSVSVLEHMPREVRAQAINRMAGLLCNRAQMLLSIDLIPNTDFLWNLNEGKILDSPEVHGSLKDLRQELESANVVIVKLDVIREIGGRTDIVLVEAHKRW
jgi:hypothetical protein